MDKDKRQAAKDAKIRKRNKITMKTAIVVSVAPTSFEALALSSDVEKAFALVASHGFDAVEIAVRDPALAAAEKILGLADDHGLAIAAIGTGQAFVEEGLSLSDADSKKRARAIERMKRQLELSAALSARVIVGLIRGTVPARADVPAALPRLAEALAELAAYAREVKSPGLLLEPINRYETRLLNSVAEVSSFLDRIADPSLMILADTFHMNIEDADMAGAIKLAGKRLGHVHFADSNRRAPGQGHTDFSPVLQALQKIGYAGYLSAEILPEPSPEQAVRLTAEFFKKARAGKNSAAGLNDGKKKK
jgi:sugar phosphate isomerase/epimerase